MSVLRKGQTCSVSRCCPQKGALHSACFCSSHFLQPQKPCLAVAAPRKDTITVSCGVYTQGPGGVYAQRCVLRNHAYLCLHQGRTPSQCPAVCTHRVPALCTHGVQAVCMHSGVCAWGLGGVYTQGSFPALQAPLLVSFAF